jgi:hypothetical protein
MSLEQIQWEAARAWNEIADTGHPVSGTTVELLGAVLSGS